MYENTVERVLKRDNVNKKIFLDVFARDEVPDRVKYPSCFIVNTHPRNKPGQHWLAFYYDKNKTCFFFDSYGRSPDYYNFKQYIEKNSIKCYYNRQRIQGQSYFCGLYCILFLLFKARNKEKIFFKKFTRNLRKNDQFINKQFNKF